MFMLQKKFAFLLFVSILFYNIKFEQAFCANSASFTQKRGYFQHTVKQGETIYSLSKMYDITIEDIYYLNPGSEISIKIGSQLKIPQKSDSFFYHTICQKETLYSTSQKYQIKQEDILKANPDLSIKTFTIGKVICIPVNKKNTFIENYTNGSKRTHMIKVALLLPFGLKDGTHKNATSKRMLEYYEGLLIALRDIKAKNISVELQVFDISSKTNLLQDIFNNPCVQDVNLIIGGLTEKQIKLISNFSDKYNIPYVIPFTSKSDEPLFHPNVYQINTPQSYLYTKVSTAFCSKYKNANIIFYVPNLLGNKIDFINIVRKDLETKKITYKIINAVNPTCSDIITKLDSNRDNVLVLSDDRQDVLLKLISLLKTIKDINTRFAISFFGYPTWQIYSVKHTSDFFYLNVAFYSVFYTDPISQKVKSFYKNYQHWYSKNLINNYPKYGILGYDTGMFFIQLLNRYSDSLAENINKSDYSGTQTNFYFERLNNNGGFINTNLYWIKFNKDFTISSNQTPIK